MQYLGAQFIGFRTSKEGYDRYQAVNPATEEMLEPHFVVATESEIDDAVLAASSAFDKFRAKSAADRATFLNKIGDEIEALGDELVERACAETGLPAGRIQGERGRTCGQLRLFATVIEEGSWVDARVDTAMPEREPVPKPDIRRMLMPMGPVAVFGASNFPLAFSTAGGDTASALATGNPVIVKAHPAHPGTAEMVARAIIRAAVSTGMPDGVFSMVHGFAEVGSHLVQHPMLEAVGFTGSHRAGRALFDLANDRPRPIPVFAEMGSINPVFVLPGALESDAGLADGLVGSVTLGCGQFCTNPGLVVGIEGDALDAFIQSVSEKMAGIEPGVMLTPGIKDAYAASAKALGDHGAVKVEGQAASAEGPASGSGVVFSTSAAKFMDDPTLHAEVFGPSTLVVRCVSFEQMLEVAKSLEGQLTATIHMVDSDSSSGSMLTNALERRVGRVIINGFPTGVEVCPSMQHGGPYPAATDSRFTSVGTAALYRFVRPVSYQGFPETLLPVELQNENPANVWRLVNGVRTRKPVKA